MRKTVLFNIDDTKKLKEKILTWSQQFDWITCLDSNEFKNQPVSPYLYHTIDTLIAIGNKKNNLIVSTCFNSLKKAAKNKDWLFGHIAYDTKNEIEKLSPSNIDNIQFPDIFFFQPRYVFLFYGNKLHIQYLPNIDTKEKVTELFNTISNYTLHTYTNNTSNTFFPRVLKNEYLNNVDKLKSHIQKGDIYEINYCQEFYAENNDIDPTISYLKLMKISPTPFACFYKLENKYLLSASPERFLKKTGNKIISQPIKGTAKRGYNEKEDQYLKNNLKNCSKEVAENIMIVDLVRNDLSKSAKKGSVHVEELCGVYTFPQVHQMISTIAAKVDKNTDVIDIVKNTFPMGSMTGAPKIKAMELIEKFENTRRGLYSGTVGYFNPEGDFDFNVVIRSILYNKEKKYVSFHVGSAITIKSDPEYEYEECLIKAKAMLKALNAKIND